MRAFEPLHAGQVGMYVCGPTVQSPPHVGHVRSAVAFDVVRRWLAERGFEVTFVRNVTDIDDKIIVTARAEGTSSWALAERNTRLFHAAYDAVGVLPPTIEPRATGHVPEIVDMIRLLLDGGHAYVTAGSVWFDVGRFGGYGELSGQRPDAMQPSAETETGKRDPRDFALWKAAKPAEPTWNTPWGPGRPGWHLECSAMAAKYLGHPFDIHGAGVDLVFPHNENERAQSICAFGEQHGEMARWWLHNGLVTLNREKMSKSTGNVFAADEALALVRPQVLRLHLSAAHYRSSLDYSEEGLAESSAAYERLETFVRNAADVLGDASADATAGPWDSAWESFAAAMDDDIGVPRALAAVHGAVTRGNGVLGRDTAADLAGWLGVVARMLGVLGLDPLTQWPVERADGGLATVLDALVRLREEARRRRDFATSDALRDAFSAAGVVIEDTPDGPRWRLS